MFLYRFDLDGLGPWMLELPNDNRMLVFAATLAHNENDDAVSAGKLYN